MPGTGDTSDGVVKGRSRRLALLASVAFALGGCIAVPIPTSETKVLAGTPVTDAQLAILDTHHTTRQDVIDHLGNPSVSWEDARVFAYSWEVRQGKLLWAVGAYVTGGAGAKDIEKHYLLLIQFDAQDRVMRFERAHRPLTQSYADFLRRWRGATAQSDAAGSGKAIVLVRIQCTVDDEPYDAFITPSFTVDPIFALGIGSFDTVGEPRVVRIKFLSDESRRAGWTYFALSPGVYYLAVVGPDSSVVSGASTSSLKKQIHAAARWRIDVPEGAPLIYAGTLAFAGTRTGKLAFGVSIIDPIRTAAPVLSDETELAHSLLRQHFPGKGEATTILLQRWHPGDPVIIGSAARDSAR